MKQWKTEAEIAKHFGIAPRTVRNFRNRRIFGFVKIGRVVRYELAQCEEAFAKFERKSI